MIKLFIFLTTIVWCGLLIFGWVFFDKGRPVQALACWGISFFVYWCSDWYATQEELREIKNTRTRYEAMIAWLEDRLKYSELMVSKGHQFKVFVHEFLDDAQVPADPYPEETKQHGCRISGRLTWLVRMCGPFAKKPQIELTAGGVGAALATLAAVKAAAIKASDE